MCSIGRGKLRTKEGFGNLLLQICFLKTTLHKKENDLALKDKQSVSKGRRPLPIPNTNFSNKGNKFTNALGDYARVATFFN